MSEDKKSEFDLILVTGEHRHNTTCLVNLKEFQYLHTYLYPTGIDLLNGFVEREFDPITVWLANSVCDYCTVRAETHWSKLHICL